MASDVTCPRCKTTINLRDHLPGQPSTCTKCGATVQIPNEPSLVTPWQPPAPPTPRRSPPPTTPSQTTVDTPKAPTEENKTKHCPYCKETIHAEAIKCRYCGEFLDHPPAPPIDHIATLPKQSPQAEADSLFRSHPLLGIAAILSFTWTALMLYVLMNHTENLLGPEATLYFASSIAYVLIGVGLLQRKRRALEWGVLANILFGLIQVLYVTTSKSPVDPIVLPMLFLEVSIVVFLGLEKRTFPSSERPKKKKREVPTPYVVGGLLLVLAFPFALEVVKMRAVSWLIFALAAALNTIIVLCFRLPNPAFRKRFFPSAIHSPSEMVDVSAPKPNSILIECLHILWFIPTAMLFARIISHHP